MSLSKKLNPAGFTEMSPKMAAIVGYIIDAKFTTPGITDLCITADGFVLAQVEGDIGLNQWIGSAENLERNWNSLLDVAQLSNGERTKAKALYSIRVTDWRAKVQGGENT
jgi:hypothetical protein